MYDDFYAVIMAGGSGTRLWPLSRRNRPKQSLKVAGDRTLFQQAVDRLDDLFPVERILIVTVLDQVALLREQCPEIPQENYIIEPLPRGTASVVGLAALAVRHRHPDATMAVLTADHLIQNADHLRELLRSAYRVAQKDYLVTIGITPGYAATGYGYIQKGDQVEDTGDLQAFSVRRFKEKPDSALAQELFADGQHAWNSGMFIWRIAAVLAEIERQMPDLANVLAKIDRVWQTDHYQGTIESVWADIKPQTIDYGIMENAVKAAVIPSLDLGWHDVGSWESLFEALSEDENANLVLTGEPLTFDTQGTLICGEIPDRLIVTIGVKNLIIIDTGDALLVCDRKEAHQLREVVSYLKQHGRERYL